MKASFTVNEKEDNKHQFNESIIHSECMCDHSIVTEQTTNQKGGVSTQTAFLVSLWQHMLPWLLLFQTIELFQKWKHIRVQSYKYRLIITNEQASFNVILLCL